MGVNFLSAQDLKFRSLNPTEPSCPRVEGEADKLLSPDMKSRPPASHDASNKAPEESYFPVGKRQDASGLGFQDMTGKVHSLSAFKGKICIIGFWSPTCGPSMSLLGELSELQPKGQQFGFQVLPIHFEGWQSVKSTLARFPKLFSNTQVYKVGVGAQGMNNVGPTLEALPAVFLVDQEGKIAYSWTGYHPGRLVDRVKKLLSESKPAPPSSKAP